LEKQTNVKFPEKFLWGSSTNAQQFEGGWDENGKGVSIADVRSLDMKTKTPSNFDDFKTASDHYHHFKEDIAYYGEMGFSLYRFTISWTRIFPTGHEREPNENGIKFYDKMLCELEKYHILPVVTLYAYDMPVTLSKEYNGWEDRRVIDDYIKYAKAVITRFKGRVKYWIPFNEQNAITFDQAYMTGYQCKDKTEQFSVEHNFALAWAECTKLVHEIDPDAKTGGNLCNAVFYPKTCNPADIEACDERIKTWGYAYSDLFCRKTYSPFFLNRFKGINISGIIKEGDMDIIRSAEPNFLSLTYYMSTVVDSSDKEDKSLNKIPNPYINQTEWGWNIDPYGFKHYLEDFWHIYQMPILITENGLGHIDTIERDGSINDEYRIEYLAEHIARMKESLEDGVQIIGYLTWSATDLYSTREGFEKRYGFVYVDKKNLSRTPKNSFYWYKKVIESNGADLSYRKGQEK
jgi:6-phospho-beta-glucosidase